MKTTFSNSVIPLRFIAELEQKKKISKKKVRRILLWKRRLIR